MDTTSTSQLRSAGLFRQGIDAFKANLVAAMLLWVVGAGIVVGYYLVVPMREAMDAVAAFRERVGIVYAMVATAMFCGTIPYFMQALMGGGRRNWSGKYLIFLTLLWAYKGVEVDLLYRGQAWVFGHDNRPLTIFLKLMVDQLVYLTTLGLPLTLLPMIWANNGYSWTALREKMRGGWYRRLILPALIPCWAVWIPAVTLIYSLPTGLQLPMQNVVGCMWALMLMFMTGEREPSV